MGKINALKLLASLEMLNTQDKRDKTQEELVREVKKLTSFLNSLKQKQNEK